MSPPLDNRGQARAVQIQTPFGLCAELPLQTFLNRVLPPLRGGLNPRTVLEALRNGQTQSHKLITKHGRWRGFARDPKHSSQSVYHTFRHLDAVVKSIVNTTKSTEHTLQFESNSSASVAKYRYSSDATFPDASFLEGSELGWEKIAVCGEFEKDEVPDYADDSIARVTNSMAKCMRHDLRRRFIFGFTIKNTDMRFWLCDRSRFLTSEPFNFITDHLPWVHFCLSILYAKPDQLGWDTSMVPLPDGRNFDIPVRSADGQTRTYRTQSILSSIGSLNRLGKGTKVWKAVRIEDGEEIGSPVVLKDCWVYTGYMREGNAVQSIRLDALTSQDEELVARMIPDIECHGDVFIGDDEPVLDCTQTLGTDEPAQGRAQGRASKPSVYQLVHYRLVLTPVMQKSIEHEMSIPTIFEALAQVADGLRLMHEAGWVHRDVSTGNILLGAQSRLVDFEYAKRASDEEDLALGTRFFRAVEVDTQSFAYKPSSRELTPIPRMTLEDLDKIATAHFEKQKEQRKAAQDQAEFKAKAKGKSRQTAAEEKPPPIEREASPQRSDPKVLPHPVEPAISPPPDTPVPGRVPLRYNPLHDLESLWWIAVYFVLQRELHTSTPDPPVDGGTASWHREEQRRWADGVFYSKDFRIAIMRAPDAGYFHTNISDIVHPAMCQAVDIIEELRVILLNRYAEVEKDPASIDFTCADGLHEQFIAKFSSIADLTHLKDVSLVPLAAAPSLIPPAIPTAAPPEPEAPPAEREPHQEDNSQAMKETKKGSRVKKQRKPTTVPPAHRYNLRPRPKRS